jgi:hypothetical protein
MSSSSAQYSRTQVYEPAVNIVQAKAFEARLREFAAECGLRITVESRGFLMRTLTVTMSGPDSDFIRQWQARFLEYNLKRDPRLTERVKEHLDEQFKKPPRGGR